MDATHPPYAGRSRGLVFAFDIGTTHSGASYALLDPGRAPQIKPVGRFLDNHTVRDAKVPSALFYDRNGSFQGVKGTVDDDEAEDLHEVRWWKLKLAPGEFSAVAKKHMTADLPAGRSIQDLFADLIRYLFDSTMAFVQESEPMWENTWETFKSNINIVLSHPNGWQGREQGFLRKSVVQAGVFTEEEALSRVSFVTEGEASFNFCVADARSGELLKPGNKVLVIDAGGGTVDISSYTVSSASPLKVEEFHEPRCLYQGAEVVTARAREYAEARFKNSRLDNKHDLATFTEAFDTGLKRSFSDNSKTQHVRFGASRDNDASCGIKGGRLTLPGDQVGKFFEPTVEAIVEAITEITAEANPAKTFVFLVGGLGANPWIFREVGRETAARGSRLWRPDTHTSKAVAIGAVSHYLNNFVVGRLVRYTYGIPVSIPYNNSDPEHLKRLHKVYRGITGELQFDVFSPTLSKGTRVSGAREFRQRIASITKFLPTPGLIPKFPVIRYMGTSKGVQWMDEDQGNFKTISRISLGAAGPKWTVSTSPHGALAYSQEYEIIYIYGLTEFKAQVAWMEEGTERRSNVAVLYDDE